MPDHAIDLIAAQDAGTEAALLALNNAHAEETSFLTIDAWRTLIEAAYAATCIGGAAALLIAFDDQAVYDGVNFQWFRSRWKNFVYVDRVIVADSHRGRGVARALYAELFRRMVASGHTTLTCEENINPPNSGSDVFHARLGFNEVGRAELPDRGKEVRYLVKDLT